MILIYISVVSHNNHEQIIQSLKPHEWTDESNAISVVILSNTDEPNLGEYCRKHHLFHIQNETQRGFGANNNTSFKYLDKLSPLSDKDYFLCINPDIEITKDAILSLTEAMAENNLRIAAPNLTTAEGRAEDNIREFPTIESCIKRLLFNSRTTNIDKSQVKDIKHVNWAAGALLCFNADTFRLLDGFDERYFMYYEDADICRRASNLSIPTYYVPWVSAIHQASKKSRELFTIHFLWHLRSAIRFTTAI